MVVVLPSRGGHANDIRELRRSLSQAPALAALWWAGKGHWDAAHRLVMDAPGPEAAWVHAYLHRLDGDLDNAGYWYRLAGRPPAGGAPAAEWELIARELLGPC